MTNFVLACIAVLSPKTAVLEPIPTDVARQRITALIASDQPTAEDMNALGTIADRVRDPGVAATARFDAGTIALALSDPSAAELLRAADKDAQDPGLRAAVRFNLAHAVLAPEADEQPGTIEEIDQRIAAYTEAARLFRSALDIDPTHHEAAANTERLRRRVSDLREQRERLEQQRQAREKLAEQLEQLAERQRRQAEQNRERSDNGQPPPEGAAGQQEQISEQTEQSEQRAEEAGASEEAQEAMKQARQAQSQARKAMEKGDAGEASERQEEAAAALDRAAKELEPDKDAQPSNEQSPQGAGEGDPPPQPASQEQAGPPRGDPLAEALIDKERREREERARYLQKRGREQVERDW